MTEQDKYKESIDEQAVPVTETEQPAVPVQETPPIKKEIPSLPEKPAEQELDKEAVPKASLPVSPSDQSQPQTQPPVGVPDSQNQAKVKELCQITFAKGLDAAIEEARKIDNPYILDEFHDALTNELYDKLIKAGKLEQK